MKKFIIFVLILLLSPLLSCTGPVQEDLEKTKAKIEELKRLEESTNATLNSVRHLISALESGSYISSVEPVYKWHYEGGDVWTPVPGREIGYRVNLWNGTGFDVILGVDGLDGYSPSFSIRKDSDGHYYWTLDGDWIKDTTGNKLRADGPEASDVKVPQLKAESGYWKISTDGGTSWTNLAEENDIFYFRVISDIDLSSDTHVTFILSDGTRLDIPRYIPVTLSLGAVSEDRVVAPGEVLTIPYTVEGTVSENLVVTSGTDGIYTSEVEQLNAREGVVKVTCPQDYSDGYVFIMVHDGGFSSVKMISFTQRQMDIQDGLSYRLDSSGGTVSVPYTSNFNFNLEFVDGTDGWIHLTDTKAGLLTLTVDANTTDAVRSGVIRIRPDDNPDFVWATVNITQSSPYFSMDASLIQVSSDGGEFKVEMNSSRGVSVSFADGSEWVNSSVASDRDFHTLTLKVAKNHSSDERTATLLVYTRDRKVIQGKVTVIQQPWNLDHYKDMVFQVRANIANDWKVYLPIRGEMNCYVDWGDGNVEIIDRTTDRTSEKFTEWISHDYDRSLTASYRVSIAGSVEALNGQDMPNKGAITAIEQWGDVGLEHMSNAFFGFPRIFSLPADPIGAFREVTDFENAFRDCIYLEEIDEDLLAYALKAVNLNDLFLSCRRLKEIPAGLLRNCAEATSFNGMFSDCQSLTSIPENIFWGCPKAESFCNTFNNTRIKVIPERLFEKCPEVVSFSGTFALTGVEAIPERLFSNNTKVKEFNRLFYYCHNFSSIPEKLFANSPEVTTFEGTFGQCYGIKEVPPGLFDNNRKVVDFGATFWDLGPGIESPYTMIEGKKVHLYERIDYPDYFITPSYTAVCYTDGWTDGKNIPIEWK